MSTDTPSAAGPVVAGLRTLLADSYALMAQTHLAHWNVEGADFFALHTAFQTQYEELFLAIDEIAERLRALDAFAPGGLKTLAGASKITEMAPARAPSGDFVKHLADSQEVLLASARDLRNAAGDAEDFETQDLAIGRIRIHEKTTWMLRSFLKR